mgnify:CR=1 FL=1
MTAVLKHPVMTYGRCAVKIGQAKAEVVTERSPAFGTRKRGLWVWDGGKLGSIRLVRSGGRGAVRIKKKIMLDIATGEVYRKTICGAEERLAKAQRT